MIADTLSLGSCNNTSLTKVSALVPSCIFFLYTPRQLHCKVRHYIGVLHLQFEVESLFLEYLVSHLNQVPVLTHSDIQVHFDLL